MKNELGMQPLDKVLEDCSLENDNLVQASCEQLTYKQVQKARQGRRITPNIKGKIVRALNDAAKEKIYSEKDLFNY